MVDLWDLTSNSLKAGAFAFGLSGTTITKGWVDFTNFVTASKVGPLKEVSAFLTESQQATALSLTESVARLEGVKVSYETQLANADLLTRIVDLTGAVLAAWDIAGNVEQIGNLQELINVNSLVGASTKGPVVRQLGTFIKTLKGTYSASRLITAFVK